MRGIRSQKYVCGVLGLSVAEVDIPQSHLLYRLILLCHVYVVCRGRFIRLLRRDAVTSTRSRHGGLELVFRRWYPAIRKSFVAKLLEAPAGLEPFTVPGMGNALIHLVNLFETNLASLVDHAVNEEAGKDTKRAPDVENPRPQVGITSA